MENLLRTIKRGILSLSLISCFAQVANSQWEKVDGIYGGTVLSLACNDTLLCAGTMLGVSVCRINDPNPAWESYAVPPDPEISALALYRDSLIVGTPAGIYITALNSPGLKDLELNLPFDFILSLDVFIDDGIPYLVATVKQHGLFVFNPASYTWTEWNTFLPSTNVIDVAQGAPISGTSHYSYYALIEGDPWLHTPSAMLANWGWSFHLPSDQPANSIIFQDGYRVVGTNQGIFRQKTAYTWEPNPGSPVKTILRVCSAGYSGDSTGLIALAEDHTIYYSMDTAITWHQAYPAFGVLPTPISFLNNGDHTFMGSDGGGIYYSSNLATWQLLEPRLEEADVRSIVDLGGHIYVGTHGAGLYRSKLTGGFDWISCELPSMEISQVAIAKFNVVVCTGGFMYYQDFEDQWHDFSYNMHDPNPCVAVSFKDWFTPLIIAKSTGIWSIDFLTDSVWHPMNQGLEGIGISDLTNANGVLYVSTNGQGAFRYNSADTVWEQLTLNGLGTQYLNSIRVAGSKIFAGSFDGIWEIEPPYETWTPQNTGLIMHNNIALEMYHDLVFGSFYPQNCFVADTASMVWHDRSDSLPEYTFIWDLYIGEYDIYAGSNRSLWKRYLGEMNPGIGNDFRESVVHCFPNPCREQFHIILNGRSTGKILCKLADLRGKVVREYTFPAVRYGENRLAVTVAGLATGLYVLEIIAADEVYVIKIVKE